MSDIFIKPDPELIPICIMPFFYYIFDYATTVYTKLLYTGNHLIVEFVPVLMCICFLIFCIVYCRQYKRQQHISTQNYLMQIKQAQLQKEMENMQRNEKNTSISQNALENAFNAVLALEPDKRFINLSMKCKNDKLLICVENPYDMRPRIENGMPVTDQRGHGLGTHSIRQTVEKLNGSCQFYVTNKLFTVRMII